jgi:hypothetical protein
VCVCVCVCVCTCMRTAAYKPSSIYTCLCVYVSKQTRKGQSCSRMATSLCVCVWVCVCVCVCECVCSSSSNCIMYVNPLCQVPGGKNPETNSHRGGLLH